MNRSVLFLKEWSGTDTERRVIKGKLEAPE